MNSTVESLQDAPQLGPESARQGPQAGNSMTRQARRGVMRRALLTAVLPIVFLLVVGVRLAEPIHDGDLFWHMAYARQMIEGGTLVPDHTLYSWMPTSNRMIYCAWASELAFYGAWKAGGPTAIFALRYALVLAAATLLWDLARKSGMKWSPVGWLCLMTAFLSSVAGSLPKPEIFSLLFMHLTVWLYFRAKLAARDGGNPLPWLYALPILMAIWVNCHGAFILSAPFFAATAAGELLSRRLTPATALPGRYILHMLVAWMLSALATAITPYGYHYPWQLFQDYVMGVTPRPDAAWNSAYQTIFHPIAWGGYFGSLLALMVALFSAALVRKWLVTPGRNWASVEWGLSLAFLAYVPLFVVYVRTTPFLVPVFAGGFFYLVGKVEEKTGTPSRRWPVLNAAMPALASVLFLFLGARTLLIAWQQPSVGSWLGFGVSYYNPVAEAEFLERSQAGSRVINLFNNGGYLLWRLWPQYAVMVDGRSFPYLEWFEEQRQFAYGRNFDEFLAAHPADVAVIELSNDVLWRRFLKTPGWKLAYYGPAAAVFVRSTIAPDKLADPKMIAPDRFTRLRNATNARLVFQFAIAAGDFTTAWEVENQLQLSLRHQTDPDTLERTRSYRAAHAALRAGDFSLAKRLFQASVNANMMGDQDPLILFLLESSLIAEATGQESQMLVYRAALARLAAPE